MDFNIIIDLKIYLKKMNFVKIMISNLDQYGSFFKLSTILAFNFQITALKLFFANISRNFVYRHLTVIK